jgi:hypothetical protein
MEIHREPLEHYLKGNNARIYNNIFGDIGYPFIIGGGSARQIFLNEDFGSTDIDIYTRINFGNIYAEFQKQGKVISNTANSITFELNERIKVQLIRKIYTLDPCYLFSTYDLSCCMFAIKDNYIYYTDLAKDHSLNKWLYIVHSDGNNLASRVGKYLLKGYTPLCPISQQIFVDFIDYGVKAGFDTDDMFAPSIEDTFREFFGISGDY